MLKLILRETHRARGLVPLPFLPARILGSLAQLTAIVGIKPLMTRDQVLSLQADNVASGQAPGLADLGIEPTGIDAVAAAYLWRYRRGGQFAEAAAAA